MEIKWNMEAVNKIRNASYILTDIKDVKDDRDYKAFKKAKQLLKQGANEIYTIIEDKKDV